MSKGVIIAILIVLGLGTVVAIAKPIQIYGGIQIFVAPPVLAPEKEGE